MAIIDTYNSIKTASEGVFKDRGSRFIALAYPVESEDEVREIVSSVKRKYHDARHHCYAFRLGLDGSVWRAGDDGEPSGTAGRPILGQIDSAGLSDVLVVVVRYFGGIKLGVPGLINAYRSAAADALGAAEVVEKVAGAWYSIGFGYSEMPAVMKILKDMDIPQRSQSFGEECSMEVRVRSSFEQDFFDRTEKKLIFINKLQ